jgi:hypothetical protein
MTNPSLRETWLGFVTMLVGGGVFQNVRRRQLLQQIQSQFHLPWIASLSRHAQLPSVRGDSGMT